MRPSGPRCATFLLFHIAFLTCAATSFGETYYTISTLAGNPLAIGDGGQATAAQLFSPSAVAVDSKGNVYIADTGGYRVRKVTRDGVIRAFAGTGDCGFAGDGGPATAAKLGSSLNGLAVDRNDNLYIADSGNSRIRQVTPAGIITTVAGGGACCSGYGGDGGKATSALLNYPSGMAFDASGNLYIADTQNQRIRRVTPAGVIGTVAGSGGQGFGGDGGPATAASLYYPNGVAVDSSGTLYIADSSNYRVRRVTPAGVIDTIAGTGSCCYNGDNIAATYAQLYYPSSVALDTAGNLYIGEPYRVRRLTPAGIIVTAAGSGTRGFSGDGSQAVYAQVMSIAGITVDASGALYIADQGNTRVRQVTTNGVINTIAGGGDVADGGPASAARLYTPRWLAADKAGNVYIADSNGHRVRRVTPAGVITTVAGTGTAGYSGDNAAATAAQLNYPSGLTCDAAGNLYISDWNNWRIRQVTPGGTIKTLAGIGYCTATCSGSTCKICSGGDNGPATAAEIYGANGMAFDAAGNLYFSDGYSRIRRVNQAGFLSTVVGTTGVSGFSGDGGPALNAQVNWPYGIAFDAAGNLYFADGYNNRIRRVAPDGFISTVVGTGSGGFGGDGGLAASARLWTPSGLAFDAAGNLYIADLNNSRVRRVGTDGVINTIAGTANQSYSGDGGPALLAAMKWTNDIAVDASGNIYVADYGNHAVRKLTPAACTYTLSPTSSGNIGDAGATGLRVNISSPLGCAWTASTNATWITITSATNGNGDGIISYSVAANTGTASRGTIALGSATFTVTQIAPGACSYSLSPASLDLTAAAGTGTVAVTAAAGCTWTATSGASWIAITAGASGNGNGTVSYSVQANAAGTPRTTTLTIAGQAFPVSQAGNTAPTFIAAGITNGASFAGGLTPGGIVTIFGTRLTKDVSGIIGADALPLPTQLAGTSVMIGGVAAPLFAVANVGGNEQINLQVPYEVSKQTKVNVVVTVNGVNSPAVQVNVLSAHSGIFTVDGKAGAILHGANNALVTTSAPAKIGEVVVIYATGLGPVNPVPRTGAAAPGSDPLARTVTTPTVTVGGKNASVQFSGLAPGFVGLYQVNIVIPAGVAAGTAVPVVITASAIASNTATIAIGP